MCHFLNALFLFRELRDMTLIGNRVTYNIRVECKELLQTKMAGKVLVTRHHLDLTAFTTTLWAWHPASSLPSNKSICPSPKLPSSPKEYCGKQSQRLCWSLDRLHQQLFPHPPGMSLNHRRRWGWWGRTSFLWIHAGQLLCETYGKKPKLLPHATVKVPEDLKAKRKKNRI